MAEKLGLTLWKHDKKQPKGKTILFTAGEPLAWQNVWPLVVAGVEDPAVAAVYLLTQGFSTAEAYAQKAKSKIVRKATDKNAIESCKRLLSKGAVSVITCPEPPQNRELWEFLKAKTQWNAAKLFYLVGGWGGFGVSQELFNVGRPITPDLPDAIFCNDDLARDVLARQGLNYEHTLVACGTPYLQNVIYETRLSESFREEGRRKLIIKEDAFVILYMGDVGQDYLPRAKKTDGINEEVIASLVRGANNIASRLKGKKDIFILVKSHPRDTFGINIQQFHAQYPLLRIMFPKRVDKRLNPSFQELVYAADIICSMAGTETLLAPYRGRCGVFVDFPTSMEFSPLNYMIGPEAKRYPHVDVTSTPQEFAKVVERCLGGERPDPPPHSHNIIATIMQYL